ncbi:MAG TPA: SDR family oxidoreductase [Phycisphaerae bacterium]|nr:SDR family oxidoreductase [Phycisphaerae bacterium]
MASAWAKAAGGLGAGLALGWLVRTVRRSAYSFRGKVVVITGGSRGLGLLMARELADEGARLALLARDEAELQRAEDELDARGAEVLTVVCDIREQDEARAAIHRVIEAFGHVDVLINNAGVMQVGPLDHLTVSDFEEAIAVHTFGPLYMVLAVLPHMLERGEGRIVNIASIGGKIAFPHLLPYTTSKFALVGLSDGLRAELRRSNLRVTTVCPGLMRTGSPINVRFKGYNRREQTWFTISDSLPVVSINGRRAARRIIDACRRGAPVTYVSAMSRMAVLVDGLTPSLVARMLAAANQVLPSPHPDRADESFTGRESRSQWSPSLLTRLSDRAAIANNET